MTTAANNPRLQAALKNPVYWQHGEARLLRPLHGGLTNESFLVCDGDRPCVLRLNTRKASRLGIDHEQELRLLRLAGKGGIAPEVCHADLQAGVLITRHVTGRHWLREDLAQPHQRKALLRLMASIQALLPAREAGSLHGAAHWIEHYWAAIDQQPFSVGIPAHVLALHGEVQRFLCEESQSRVLAHSDLVPENIIVAADGRLLALDWEYAGARHPLFELAALLHEHRGCAGADTLREEAADYLPVDEDALQQQLALVRYLNLLWYRVQYGKWQVE